MSAAGLNFVLPVGAMVSMRSLETVRTAAVRAHAVAQADAPASAAADEPAARRESARRDWLCWAFTFFNSARVLAYLPTLWAIHASGDSSQHSLWTWITWFCANATMAAWLHERGNGEVNRAVCVNCVNALMCAAAIALIVWYRI